MCLVTRVDVVFFVFAGFIVYQYTGVRKSDVGCLHKSYTKSCEIGEKCAKSVTGLRDGYPLFCLMGPGKLGR